MTATSLLILTGMKDLQDKDYFQIFKDFINNILVQLIHNTNNQTNVFLRQIACQCLEELETEYPGLLFSLMGKKTIEMLKIKDANLNNTSIKDNISQVSNARFSTFSSKTNVTVNDKKIELESNYYKLFTILRLWTL